MCKSARIPDFPPLSYKSLRCSDWQSGNDNLHHWQQLPVTSRKMAVLVSAGTELIIRRSWPKPAKRDTPYHVRRHGPYITGAAGRGGKSLLGSRPGIGWQAKLPCASRTSYILFTNIIVVISLFLCCSLKLSLSQRTSLAFFFWFSSPSHWGGRRSEWASGRVARLGLNHDNGVPKTGTAAASVQCS